MNLKIIGCKIYFKVITQMYLSEQNPQMENPSCTTKINITIWYWLLFFKSIDLILISYIQM